MIFFMIHPHTSFSYFLSLNSMPIVTYENNEKSEFVYKELLNFLSHIIN